MITSTRVSLSARARKASSSSDGRSAVWRSSRSTTSGSARGGVAQEDGDGVEEREARLLGLEVAGLGQVQALAQLGRELGHPARAGAELGAQRVVVAVGRERAHDLHPRPEGGRAAAVPAARPRDAVAVGRRALAQRGGQARLADAGLAREQHEAAVPGRRLLERRVEIGQLARAPE